MTSKWAGTQTWYTGHGREVEAVCDADAPLRAEAKRSSEPACARAQKRTKPEGMQRKLFRGGVRTTGCPTGEDVMRCDTMQRDAMRCNSTR